MLSARSMSIVSSEEGEASEYPSSHPPSTLESNPEMMHSNQMPSLQLEILGARNASAEEDEDDNLSVVTLTTARRSAEGVL